MKLMKLEVVSSADTLTSEKILSVITAHNCIVDSFIDYHENEVTTDGVLRYPHFHIYLRFKTPQNPDNVCDWFGVPRTVWNRFSGFLDVFKDIREGVKI